MVSIFGNYILVLIKITNKIDITKFKKKKFSLSQKRNIIFVEKRWENTLSRFINIQYQKNHKQNIPMRL